MKVAVVTGSNRGIGLAIVRQLCAQFDGEVYLTARDVGRGAQAVADLATSGTKAYFHQLDISDVSSVERLRDFLKDKYGGLDVLINNAAIAYKNSATEPFEEQAENTMRVNFFDQLRLSRIIFPILRPHARVVNLSSYAGHLSKIPGEDLREKLSSPTLTEQELESLIESFVQQVKQGEHLKNGWPPHAYAVSKVAITALTFVQQRAFNEDDREDIVVNAVHPGYCDTDMTSHKGPMTVEEGADAPVYLAMLPDNVATPRGKYVWRNRQEVDWVHGPLPGAY